jgi:hypothetical protein
MIAKVTLGIKFIGGSSLNGPLNKLQNALSFNYYANTEVYDPRADYIEIKDNVGTIKDGEKIASGYSETLIGTEASASSNNNAGGNQNTTQEIEAQKEETGPVDAQTGTTIEPKITGIQTAGWIVENTTPTNLLFKLKLNTQNLFDNNGNLLISDSEFNSFMSKGVKITLEENQPISGSEKIFYQETITDKTNENKDIFLNGRTIEIINKDLTIRRTNDFTLKINYPNTPQYNQNIIRVNLI